MGCRGMNPGQLPHLSSPLDPPILVPWTLLFFSCVWGGYGGHSRRGERLTPVSVLRNSQTIGIIGPGHIWVLGFRPLVMWHLGWQGAQGEVVNWPID